MTTAENRTAAIGHPPVRAVTSFFHQRCAAAGPSVVAFPSVGPAGPAFAAPGNPGEPGKVVPFGPCRSWQTTGPG